MLRTAYNCALDLLSQREHSQTELLKKLTAKGFAIDEIKIALQSLEKNGLQSDLRFIQSYISMRSKKGFGPVRIELELRERGIVSELIKHELLENTLINWGTLAEEVRCKKFGKAIPTDFSSKIKQMRYLYYKGFDNDTIKELTKSK